MKISEINFFNQKCRLVCDEKCQKAWGINNRPTIELSDNPDDFCYLTDEELGDAPTQSPVWEGGYNKPVSDKEKHNKWCVRECERSELFSLDKVPFIRDFSKRIKNIPDETITHNI